MSWSFGIPATLVIDFAAAADAALEAARPNILSANPAGIEQAEIAVKTVKEFVAAGLVGTGYVAASLSGHGNPKEGTPAYPNDSLSIALYAVLPPVQTDTVKQEPVAV